MQEQVFFSGLLWSWFVLSACVFVVLLWITAPYGRHGRQGWGPTLPSVWGWILMESPAILVPLLCFGLSVRSEQVVAQIFLGMWLFHYLHRGLIYPWQMRMQGKRMAWVIVALAFFTNIGINYLNARWLFSLGPVYANSWLHDPRFVLGVCCFVIGWAINRHSDHVLKHLRQPGDKHYSIPRGGLYCWVSCPNYLGEIVQWGGWALATWSLPGLAFALWTASNLVPRALSHHRWYREKFSDYPQERRALIPKLL